MPRLDGLLAGLLLYGTWLASGVTFLGLSLAFTGARDGLRLVTLGIALFIALPALRVCLMLLVFARQRDRRFIAISALVLAILLTAFELGAHMARS
jgi:uncharacterized membrane protein